MGSAALNPVCIYIYKTLVYTLLYIPIRRPRHTDYTSFLYAVEKAGGTCLFTHLRVFYRSLAVSRASSSYTLVLLLLLLRYRVCRPSIYLYTYSAAGTRAEKTRADLARARRETSFLKPARVLRCSGRFFFWTGATSLSILSRKNWATESDRACQRGTWSSIYHWCDAGCWDMYMYSREQGD